MKKSLRCLVSVICMLAVALMASTAVSAAGVSSLAPDSGRLIIHRYVLDSIDALGLPGDGRELQDAPQGATPLADIEFTIWRVNEQAAADAETPAQAKQYIDAASAIQVITGADGSATASLEQGIYYVEETKSVGRVVQAGGALSIVEHSYVPCAPFVVSVPMRSPDAIGWLADVHVYPKGQSIYIDKFVNGSGEQNYDSSDINAAKYKPVYTENAFGWTIVSSLPGGLGTAHEERYVVRDTLSNLFSYQADTLSVYSAGTADTPCEAAHKLCKDIDYIESFNPDTNTLTVQLTAEGLAMLGERYNDAASADRFLIIKYDCTLNKNAPHGVSIPSGASVTYIRHDDPTSPLPDTLSEPLPAGAVAATSTVVWEPAVHTGQISVTKLDKQDPHLPLQGAHFGLAATKADAEAGIFLQTGTSDEYGHLVFSGLIYGLPGDKSNQNSNNTSYWLLEITPPSGYAPLSEPVEVLFSHQLMPQTGEIYFARLTVYNEALDDGGAPGGIWGSGIFGKRPQTGDDSPLGLAIGALLLSAAAFFFFFKLWPKRRRVPKDDEQ